MVRAYQFYPFLSSAFSSFLLLLFCPFTRGEKLEKVQEKGWKERWQRIKRSEMKDEDRKEREKKRSGEWAYCSKMCGCRGEGDDRRDVPFFFCRPIPSLSFWCFHGSLIYSPPLLPFELMCHFMLCAWFFFIFYISSSLSVHGVLLCFGCLLCIFLWKTTGVISINLSFPCITVFPFLAVYIFFFLPPSEIRCCHSR